MRVGRHHRGRHLRDLDPPRAERGHARFDGNLDVAAFVRCCGRRRPRRRAAHRPLVPRRGAQRRVPRLGSAGAGRAPHRRPRATSRSSSRGSPQLGEQLAAAARPGEQRHRASSSTTSSTTSPGTSRRSSALAREAGLARPALDRDRAGAAPSCPRARCSRCTAATATASGSTPTHDWDTTFREHYFFSHTWDDPGIGADLRAHPGIGRAARDAAAAVGLVPGRHLRARRRHGDGVPPPSAAERRAMSPRSRTTRSATARRWQGYYMYAGGTNPRPGLQESHASGYPNDLPRVRLRLPRADRGSRAASRRAMPTLRRQHAFLAAFGATSRPCPRRLPAHHPTNVDDTENLRWAVRSDGASGWLFITWQQPHVPLRHFPRRAVRGDPRRRHDRAAARPDRRARRHDRALAAAARGRRRAPRLGDGVGAHGARGRRRRAAHARARRRGRHPGRVGDGGFDCSDG